MKTSRAVLAAGLMAGLSALPLSASAAAPADTPMGSASAAALQLTVSLQPLKNVLNTGGAWQLVSSQLQSLQNALCTPTTLNCLGLKLPTDLPDSLTVRVAQANDTAVLNKAASDIVSGHSDSTPVATDWAALNANLSALESALSQYINSGTAALASSLASGNLAGLTSFLNGVSLNGLNLNLGVLGTAHLNILGTVAANLGQKDVKDTVFDSANAVSITGIGQGLVDKTGMVIVDPFQACAASATLVAKCSQSQAQVSASNTLVKVGLPDLLGTNVNAAELAGLANTLKSLINSLSQAIANPSSAGSIITNAAGSLPAGLSGPVGTLGGVLGSAVNQATGAVSSTAGLDLSGLKVWDAHLAAALDSLNGLIDAVAKLQLPDITNLVTSTNDIATAQTVPVLGGGVASTATSTLGAVNVLPIGGVLSSLVNTAISTTGLGLSQVTASTPLLSVAGITASAQAAVGAGSSSPTGSAGLRTVSVLGQTIDLDKATAGLALGPGQEWNIPVSIPALGTLTLDITRGVPQIVADTPTYREVHMAALDVRLINGKVACSTSQCSNPLAVGAVGGSNSARVAGTGSSSNGISALGSDGSTLLEIGAPVASALAGIPPTTIPNTGCTADCTTPGGNQAHLVNTGMFGGAGIPAGLLLIGVAISLRLLPNTRLFHRRVR